MSIRDLTDKEKIILIMFLEKFNYSYVLFNRKIDEFNNFVNNTNYKDSLDIDSIYVMKKYLFDRDVLGSIYLINQCEYILFTHRTLQVIRELKLSLLLKI